MLIIMKASIWKSFNRLGPREFRTNFVILLSFIEIKPELKKK